MNSKQVYHALFKNPVTFPFFDGVYPIDQLEEIIMKPQLVIVNTDPSNSKGEHWVAIFFEGNSVNFFDSFGQKVSSYGEEIVNFIDRYSNINQCISSTKRVQPLHTDICGELCLYFAYLKCLGFDLNTIIKSLSDVEKALKFVDNHYHICKKCSDLQSVVAY